MLVLPVYGRIILPDADVYFQAEEFKHLAGRAVLNEKIVILQMKEQQKREDVNDESFYPIGIFGYVKEIDQSGYVVVRTQKRVEISEVIVKTDHSIELTMKKLYDKEDITMEELDNKREGLKSALRELASEYTWGSAVMNYVEMMDSLASYAAFLTVWVNVDPEEGFSLLKEDSLRKRSERLEKKLYEYIETAKVTADAASAQQKEYRDIYRESAIKKQMEYLQKELDEMHPEELTDIRKFEMKIEDSGMNETARKEADKVLNRLKQEGKNSPESGMLYDYLDFMTSLNWKKEQFHKIELEEARSILDEDHYGMKKVKKRVIQQIAIMNLKKEQSGSILLFVGAPGTGKTSIGKSIAKALSREYVRVSLGGIRDEADIRGHRRTYIGAMPGRIMDGIQKSGVSNPVMVLDEVDKIASSYHGDPASALLEVLDPEQNNTFTDHYMNVPYDLSDVMFICTANSVDTIPEPLLNRMEIIQFDGYTPVEKLSIAREHLLPKSMKSMGIDEEQMDIPDDVLKCLINDFTREAGVRGLRQRIDTLCRTAAVSIAEGNNGRFSISTDELRDKLDIRPVRHEKLDEEPIPGVVTGLAWTAAGGEVLFVEAVQTKGKGGIIITGQLGDVMKESAQIAVSLVKKMFPDKAKLFATNDLHIHVPEGAVPKDGPSAGITLTTAIASLVTGIPVSPKIAMTGEVSLRGVVTPIGGLPEKLLAAQRAGVKRVFIPAENQDDLKDVPGEIIDNLEIIPVSDVSEVLKGCKIELKLEKIA